MKRIIKRIRKELKLEENGFDDELEFWNLELSMEGQFSTDIVNRVKQNEDSFPSYIMEWVSKIHEKKDALELAHILDVGCGALSQLAYGNKAKLFKINNITKNSQKAFSYAIYLLQRGAGFGGSPGQKGNKFKNPYPDCFHFTFGKKEYFPKKGV